MSANNVQDAIDVLYEKANQTYPDTYKDLATPVTATASDLLYGKTAYKQDGTIVTGTINTYNGNTNITPTTSSQTIETSGKYVGNNITVGAIPSSYKNISDTTITTSSDILNGLVAYKADGTKITGTGTHNCVKGSFSCTTTNGCTNSTGYPFLDFMPTTMSIITSNNNVINELSIYNTAFSTEKVYFSSPTTTGISTYTFSQFFKYENNKLKLYNNPATVDIIYFIACH